MVLRHMGDGVCGCCQMVKNWCKYMGTGNGGVGAKRDLSRTIFSHIGIGVCLVVKRDGI